mmetsp:Transcript_22563/g.56009  ORF Transcript_22563/g.56009 Transcript_22563/m.56009 type:complete len:266 (-) Transcript_22563:1016-1813(-)
MAIRNHGQRVLALLRLAIERILILALPLRGLVHPEPLPHLAHHPGERLLDVRHGVNLRRLRILRIDRQHLPVRLALIDQRQDAQRLHRVDGAHRHGLLADLDHVDGVLITAAAGIGVHVVGVLVGLGEGAVVDEGGPVFVVAERALLDVLLDGREVLGGGDLHLGGGAAGDFVDEVHERLLVVGVQRNVVPRGSPRARRVLEEEAELEGIGFSLLCSCELRLRRDRGAREGPGGREAGAGRERARGAERGGGAREGGREEGGAGG